MYSSYSRFPYQHSYLNHNNNYNMNSIYSNRYNYDYRTPININYSNPMFSSTNYSNANNNHFNKTKSNYSNKDNYNTRRNISQKNYPIKNDMNKYLNTNKYRIQEESKYQYENKKNYDPYSRTNYFQNNNNNNRKYSIDYNRRNIPNGMDTNKKNNQQNIKKEKPKSNAELTLDYENRLREEIELKNPFVSKLLDIKILLEDYKSNKEYSNSIKTITEKYHNIRKICRDGNCFYRSFIFRLFEHICTKNDEKLYNKIKQKIIDSKNITEKNGYEWEVVKDFYEIFLNELNYCFNIAKNKKNITENLNKLFNDKEKGNYMIYFIRLCIAAYIKENSNIYNVYTEGNFEEWVRNEVEAIDHEADQIQIMGCVNYFDVGVKIEYLNKNKSELIKLPEDKAEDEFFIFVLFSPGHYDILYP